MGDYRSLPTVAVYHLMGGMGLEIKRIDNVEDEVCLVDSLGKSHRAKLYMSGRAYFKYRGMRVYLDDCIRV